MNKTIHLLIKDPAQMDAEVRAIITSMYPDFDFSRYENTLTDMTRLFAGDREGYAGCDTGYHDWPHTMGTLLATARLLHGVHVDRQELSARIIELALLAALFHDCGYIRRADETAGSGGQFTRNHVQRSIDMLEEHADDQNWPVEDILDMECMILTTDPARSPDTIVYTNIETMMAGHVLGTADLISQMADDIYLEKLPFLFLEFVEGGVTEFTSEYDLFMKTLGFYTFMRTKMENRLSNVLASMAVHFRERHGIERDFYTEAIARNMNYLASILELHGEAYHQGLRRRLDRKEFPIKVAA